MERPGWATIVGIIMLLIGGCGAFDNIGEMNVDQMKEMKNIISMDVQAGKAKASDSDTTALSDIDSSNQEVLKFFGDSIVKDSNQQVDIVKTMESMVQMSDYRIKWIKTFAYIGIFISILFIVSGILFLSQRKWVIQTALITLAVSLLVGIFQFIIFKADEGTSNLIHTFGNVEIYAGIFIDIVLLIMIMVLDKSFYNDAYYKEDFYDNAT
jgi:uncharacterized membrane protein YozB (DUF420 family)